MTHNQLTKEWNNQHWFSLKHGFMAALRSSMTDEQLHCSMSQERLLRSKWQQQHPAVYICRESVALDAAHSPDNTFHITGIKRSNKSVVNTMQNIIWKFWDTRPKSCIYNTGHAAAAAAAVPPADDPIFNILREGLGDVVLDGTHQLDCGINRPRRLPSSITARHCMSRPVKNIMSTPQKLQGSKLACHLAN
jgi:hypothetical protein